MNFIINILFQRADTAEAILKDVFFCFIKSQFPKAWYATHLNVNYLSTIISVESFAQFISR